METALKKAHCLAIILTFWPIFWFATNALAAPHENLQNLGFTLLNAPPLNFELSGLDGQVHSLKGYKGKWILLAFWATWCGPCNEEIPQLEKLYQDFRKKGLAVIGVSVDQERSVVIDFQKEKRITFPILLDDGKAASKYQASALPTLYVVSPDWKLVGVLRGARDWSSPDVKDQISALLQHREYKEENAGIKMTEEDGSLSLPNNLAPPILGLEPLREELKKGKNTVTVSVAWKDNPKDYVIKVPKLTVSEGVKIGEVSSSSTGGGETTTLLYHFPLEIEKEGTIKIGPVELGYSPRNGGKELFSRNEGMTFEVKRKDWTAAIVSAVGLLGILLLSFILFEHMKRIKRPEKFSENHNWNKEYEEIRRLKIHGKHGEYITALLKLNLEMDEKAGTKNQAVVSLLEKVKFGSSNLSETDLLNFEKRIERAIGAENLKAEET